MQVYKDPVTFYLMALPYTRALYPIGRKGKIESTEDQGPLGTRPESDTHHFLLFLLARIQPHEPQLATRSLENAIQLCVQEKWKQDLEKHGSPSHLPNIFRGLLRRAQFSSVQFNHLVVSNSL